MPIKFDSYKVEKSQIYENLLRKCEYQQLKKTAPVKLKTNQKAVTNGTITTGWSNTVYRIRKQIWNELLFSRLSSI